MAEVITVSALNQYVKTLLDAVSYTHLRAHETRHESRMPSSA